MKTPSNKWSVTVHDASVVIEYYDPTGLNVVARATFDADAIGEFIDALTEAAEIIR